MWAEGPEDGLGAHQYADHIDPGTVWSFHRVDRAGNKSPARRERGSCSRLCAALVAGGAMLRLNVLLPSALSPPGRSPRWASSEFHVGVGVDDERFVPNETRHSLKRLHRVVQLAATACGQIGM